MYKWGHSPTLLEAEKRWTKTGFGFLHWLLGFWLLASALGFWLGVFYRKNKKKEAERNG